MPELFYSVMQKSYAGFKCSLHDPSYHFTSLKCTLFYIIKKQLWSLKNKVYKKVPQRRPQIQGGGGSLPFGKSNQKQIFGRMASLSRLVGNALPP